MVRVEAFSKISAMLRPRQELALGPAALVVAEVEQRGRRGRETPHRVRSISFKKLRPLRFIMLSILVRRAAAAGTVRMTVSSPKPPPGAVRPRLSGEARKEGAPGHDTCTHLDQILRRHAVVLGL